MERKIVLELKGVSKYFGGLKAIDEIDMKLYDNEIIAIVGDNGAGKSTIIKVISGVYKKDSGEIYKDGQKIDINAPADAKRMGIETVYQEGALIPAFNAYLNLFLGREKSKDNILGKFFKCLDYNYMKNETVKLLEKIGIELKDIDEKMRNLSGGQRQSVMVGKAVYWGGEVLIFDEPTNNLGVKQEKNIIELIKKIREEFKVSIIIISHNIAHVFDMVDRIIVLRSGKIVGERIKNETNPNEIVSLIMGADQVA